VAWWHPGSDDVIPTMLNILIEPVATGNTVYISTFQNFKGLLSQFVIGHGTHDGIFTIGVCHPVLEGLHPWFLGIEIWVTWIAPPDTAGHRAVGVNIYGMQVHIDDRQGSLGGGPGCNDKHCGDQKIGLKSFHFLLILS
jgi:hypothetical protein